MRLLIHPTAVTILDLTNDCLNYYESFQRSDERDLLSRLKFRSTFFLPIDSNHIDFKKYLKKMCFLNELNLTPLEVFDYSLLSR
jgi:hypothetical protein